MIKHRLQSRFEETQVSLFKRETSFVINRDRKKLNTRQSSVDNNQLPLQILCFLINLQAHQLQSIRWSFFSN